MTTRMEISNSSMVVDEEEEKEEVVEKEDACWNEDTKATRRYHVLSRLAEKQEWNRVHDERPCAKYSKRK